MFYTKKDRQYFFKFCEEVCYKLVDLFKIKYKENESTKIDGLLETHHSLYDKSLDCDNLDNMCDGLPYNVKAPKYYNEMVRFCTILTLFSITNTHLIHEKLYLNELDKLNKKVDENPNNYYVHKIISKKLKIMEKLRYEEITKNTDAIFATIFSCSSMLKFINTIDYYNNFFNNILQSIEDITKDYSQYSKKVKNFCDNHKKKADWIGKSRNRVNLFKHKTSLFCKYLVSSETDLSEWTIKSIDRNYDSTRKEYGKKFTNIRDNVLYAIDKLNSDIIKTNYMELCDFKTFNYDDEKIDDAINNIIKMIDSVSKGVNNIYSVIIELICELKFNIFMNGGNNNVEGI